ncbi:MAG: phosphoribosylformylglycinamidine synthase subunit PurL [Deltaproteobacteria bacterium]
MSKVEVTEVTAVEHGLTPSEYAFIVKRLGRTPTIEELGVVAVMWSEHCSYKSSRPHLGRFPSTGPTVLQGPGENAGAVDIGGGMAAVFKIESHNHPSYIEPYQGAATGVGGILRDIFTMGARPVANLNSLWFGSADHSKTPFLLGGVVAGIGGYGNSVGVPTVGGGLHFDPGYDGNILVNAFNLGVVRADRIFRAVAKGVGNPVLYVGSKTGRDGIHGASLLASSEFKEESEQMRPTVQVGDPFTENLLIEACLEVLAGDDVVAIQDMGAAGLTSSSAEMAGRGGMGIRLNLDLIPLRDETLTPYEMLLSESQERMLLVVHSGREEAVSEIFHRWGLDCTTVGEVTEDGRLSTLYRGEEVVSLPVELLDDVPVVDRPLAPPTRTPAALDLDSFRDSSDPGHDLLELLSSANLCSRAWVWQQYDSYVGANTVVGPGGDAAVVRVRENGAALAMTTDCNSRYVSLDPCLGAQHAVAEAVRNVSVTGATPLAISDCLNFGNPEKPEVMWQFSRAVDGIAEACRAFDVPVISGNVSFYNDTRGASIPPTPVVAMVGLIEKAESSVGAALGGPGQLIYLLGDGLPELEGSEYLQLRHGLTGNRPPTLDLEAEVLTSRLCRDLIGRGLVYAAHDVADGGVAVALAEMCINGDTGVRADLPALAGDGRIDTALFGEGGCRILLAIDSQNATAVEAAAETASLGCSRVGISGGEHVTVAVAGRVLIDLGLDGLKQGWQAALGDIADRKQAA